MSAQSGQKLIVWALRPFRERLRIVVRNGSSMSSFSNEQVAEGASRGSALYRCSILWDSGFMALGQALEDVLVIKIIQ